MPRGFRLGDGETGMQTFNVVAVAAWLILFVLIAPALVIAFTKDRLWLRLMAIVLTVSSLAAYGAASFAGIGNWAILPPVSIAWLGGLICAVAAFLDGAAERRNNEIVFRLLHDDARYLSVPQSLRTEAPPSLVRKTMEKLFRP